jgi:hypothetical protein
MFVAVPAYINNGILGLVRWLTSVIPSTSKVEIGKTEIQDQPWQKVGKTLFQSISPDMVVRR